MSNITNEQMQVMIKIIGAVETGGQVYGKCDYSDYTPAYANSSAENSITIGAFQEFNWYAKALLKEILTTYPDVFKKYDNAGIQSDLNKSSWDGYSPSKTSAKANAIKTIIGSPEGIKIQNIRIERLIKTYVAFAESQGVTDVDALFMSANFIHQGGNSALTRILKKTTKPYTLENLYTACQSDTGNQVGAYRNRQKFVYESLKKYLKKDMNGGNNVSKQEIIQKIIDDAVEFAVNIAKDSSHGYSQQIRSLFNITNPKSFDCSSLVITSFYYAFMKNGLTEQAEYLKTHCSYTGNMMYMINCGFEVVARNQTAHASMVKGDIELNTTHHTALAIDKDNIVHARTSEGTSNTIDDSGNEIRVQPWYNYSHGWTHRLRFTGKGIDFSNIKPSNISLPSFSTSIPSTKSYLSLGDTGSEVKSLQQKLNILGYKGADGKSLTEDGQFGNNTDHAVRTLQADAKIEIDGKAGKGTMNVINSKIEALQKPTNQSNSTTSTTIQLIKDAQIHLNNFTGSKLTIDGKYGTKTKKAFISAIQIALNKDYGYNFSCKGVWGDKTELALSKAILKKGMTGYLITVAEIGMLLNNINPNGVECPGIMGHGLVSAVKQYQKNKGLVQDGIVGINTWKSLCK